MTTFLKMLKKTREDLTKAGMSPVNINLLLSNGQVSFTISNDHRDLLLEKNLKRLGLIVDITSTEDSLCLRTTHRMWVRI